MEADIDDMVLKSKEEFEHLSDLGEMESVRGFYKS